MLIFWDVLPQTLKTLYGCFQTKAFSRIRLMKRRSVAGVGVQTPCRGITVRGISAGFAESLEALNNVNSFLNNLCIAKYIQLNVGVDR